jgi:hypothetical protein
MDLNLAKDGQLANDVAPGQATAPTSIPTSARAGAGAGQLAGSPSNVCEDVFRLEPGCEQCMYKRDGKLAPDGRRAPVPTAARVVEEEGRRPISHCRREGEALDGPRVIHRRGARPRTTAGLGEEHEPSKRWVVERRIARMTLDERVRNKAMGLRSCTIPLTCFWCGRPRTSGEVERDEWRRVRIIVAVLVDEYPLTVVAPELRKIESQNLSPRNKGDALVHCYEVLQTVDDYLDDVKRTVCGVELGSPPAQDVLSGVERQVAALGLTTADGKVMIAHMLTERAWRTRLLQERTPEA